MKKRCVSVLGAVFCLVFLFGVLPQGFAAEGKVFNLKIANFFPPPSKQSKITQEFGEELEKRSGGQIKVQYFAGGSLLKGPTMYQGITTGIADIGYSHVYYTPGRMPVMEGAGLPIGTPSAFVGAHMAYDFYQQFKPKEFDNVKVLAIHGNAPSMIMTKKPVKKMEDLKGLTIRAPGIPGEIIKALGGTPAPTPMMEVYDAISKGVNDGVWGPYETLKTFRFGEVTSNVAICWQIGSVFCFYLAMNQNSYNKLPKDLQSLIDVMGGQYQERFALMWNEIEMEGKAFGTSKGMKYNELSDEEGARWQKAMEPVMADYVKTLVEKGYTESEVRGWFDFMKERIKYWTAKQIEYKIPSPTGPAGMRPEAFVQ